MRIDKTLDEFLLDEQHKYPNAKGELTAIISGLSLAARILHREINKAGLADITGPAGSDNIQGEEQQKLDVFANEHFKTALSQHAVVCGLASEEEQAPIILDSPLNLNGEYLVLIDPLDGSSNIDVNVSVGTIFSIFKRISPKGKPATLADFLQTGREQVAAGYILYGSSTMLVYTTGDGVNGFTYDPSLGLFCLSHPQMKFKQDGHIVSVNFCLSAQFKASTQAYLTATSQASKPPLQGRYIGSLVSDFHRNLIKGGIYLYPSTQQYPQGKLRLLYECNPIAYIAEQAGGRAHTGPGSAVLDIEPLALHQRVCFAVGPEDMMNELISFGQSQDSSF